MNDFSSVEEAMDTMENAAGSADREMDIIRDSLEYKINQLKQTWVGLLQELIDRGDMGKLIDSLTTISEAIANIVSKLGLLKTAIAAIAGVIGSQKLSFLSGGIGLFSSKEVPSNIQGLQGIREYFAQNGNAGLSTERSKVNLQSGTLIDMLDDVSKQLLNTWQTNGADAAEMVTNIDNRIAQLGQTSVSVGSSLAKIGTSLVKGLAVAGVSAALTWLIGKLVEVADKAHLSAEEAEEMAKQFRQSYSEMVSEQKDAYKTIQEVNDEYEILSKGVNDLGKNISLTDEEFERYHEITSQIASAIPELVSGYDEQGNAIIRLKDNVNDLSEAYKNAQIQAAKKIYYEYDEENDRYVLEGTMQNAANIFGERTMDDSMSTFDYMEMLREVTQISQDDMANISDSTRAALQFFEMLDTEEEDFLKKQQAAADKLAEYEMHFEEATEDIKDIASVYAMARNEEYQDLDDARKEYVDSVINSLDMFDVEELGLSDTGELRKYVDDLVDTISKIDDFDLNKTKELAIGITTSWNNNELSYDEYIEKIKELDEFLSQILPNDEYVVAIKLLFDIPSVEDVEEEEENAVARRRRLINQNQSRTYAAENLASNSEYDNMDLGQLGLYSGGNITNTTNDIKITQAEQEYQEELDAINDELYDSWLDKQDASVHEFIKTLDESDFAITANFTGEEQFDEWLAKLQEDASITIDVTYSTDAVEGLDELSDAFEGGLNDVFDEVLGDDATSTFASASNLQSLNDDFGGVTFDFGDDEIADANAMSNAIEAFNDAMTNNDNVLKAAEGDTSAYKEAVNELATAYVDQSGILENLTEDNYEYYISVLKSKGVTNAEEVVLSRLGETAQHTSESLTSLSLVVAQYKKDFESAAENDDWSNVSDEATTKLGEATEELLDSTGILQDKMSDDDWVKFAEDNFDTIQEAIEGNIDSIKELRRQIALMNYEQEYEGLAKVQENVQNIQDKFTNLSGDEYEGLINGTLTLKDIGITDDLNEIESQFNTATEQGRKDFENYLETAIPDLDIGWETRNGLTWTMTIDYKGSSVGTNIDDLSDPNDDDDSDDDDDDDDEVDIEYAEETFDWVETAIDRLESQIDRLDQEVENVYDNWSKRNGALAEEIDAITQEIEMQSDAADKYFEEAEEVYIPDEYKTKIQNGEMDVETINESNITDDIISYFNDLLAQGIGDAEDIEAYTNGELQNSDYVNMLSDAIDDYTDLYEKAMDASDEVVSLTIEKQGLFQDYFDNIKDEYEDFIDVIDKKVDWIEERIDRTEEHGYFVDQSYYEDLLSNEKDNFATLTAQRDELIEAMNTAVSVGGIEKGSSAWNEMYEDILDVNQAIEESLTNTVKLNNEIRQLNWDKFDYLEERLGDINDEAEFFIKLLSGEDMYDDQGLFNDRGWANAAMVASKYNDTLLKAQRYKAELTEIEQDLADDPYNKDLIEREEELTQHIGTLVSKANAEFSVMIFHPLVEMYTDCDFINVVGSVVPPL